ncbi:NUDIX hydrolase [Pseudorhodoplanes sp.]|uniref:NUDIX hydrolase n=1 Tax=Pseudorhodoplanes sp. TaxID=1934341 RepID=UPI0039197026
MADILRIERLDLAVADFDWDFARTQRAAIDAHFEATRRIKPGMWNGRVLLTHAQDIDGDCLRARYFETDFASFMAWRDFGFADDGVRNCFALGALQGSDGAFVMGVMSNGTMNAGKIYFPGGTPDLNDVEGAWVNLEASVRREVQEETGLDAAQFDIDSGWHCILAGPLVALLKPMRAREPAAALCERIRGHIASEPDPELAEVHVARGPGDIHPAMPGFIQTFLRSAAR